MNPVDSLRAELGEARAELSEARKKLAKFESGRVSWLSVPKRGLALGFTEKERVVHWGAKEDEIVKVR